MKTSRQILISIFLKINVTVTDPAISCLTSLSTAQFVFKRMCVVSGGDGGLCYSQGCGHKRVTVLSRVSDQHKHGRGVSALVYPKA